MYVWVDASRGQCGFCFTFNSFIAFHVAPHALMIVADLIYFLSGACRRDFFISHYLYDFYELSRDIESWAKTKRIIMSALLHFLFIYLSAFWAYVGIYFHVLAEFLSSL